MDIEFDSTKDEINRQKHNLPLAFGAVVLANKVGEVEDTRRDYGERRMKAYAEVNGLWFECGYTVRGDVVHIFTVHRVRAKEVRKWLSR